MTSEAFAGLDQAVAPAMGAAANSAGQAAATGVSTAAIADGTEKKAQGEAQQNMMQMAAGAMQMLSGLMGLLGAAGLGKTAAANSHNASDMSGLGGPYASSLGSGTSPTPKSDASGTSGSNGPNGTTGTLTPSTAPLNSGSGLSTGSASIIPPALQSPQAIGALKSIQQTYGLTPAQVVNALQNGASPQDILANAPKNAPPAARLGKLADAIGASNSLAAQDASQRILASANAKLAESGNADASGEMNLAGGVPAAKSESSADPLAALEGLGGANSGPGVSPAVKAALADQAAKAQAERDATDMTAWNIFQLVHHRYQKLETMLYGRVERTNLNPISGLKTNN